MNIFLWVLQGFLALHTVIGAAWKFSNTVPSLSAIPQGAWQSLSVFEIICALFLIIPAFKKRLGFLAPIGALGIAAEMLLFTGLNLASGDQNRGEIVYWLVVAAICAFIAYGRFRLRPH